MKIKEFSELSEGDLVNFNKSRLAQIAHYDYAFCDIHLKYYIEYFGKTWRNLSLVAYDDKDFYICIYCFTNSIEISFFGSPIQIFAIENAHTKTISRAYQELFAKIGTYKDIYGATQIKFCYNQHFIAKYYEKEGFSSTTEYYNIIDLEQSEEEIQMNVRKSYKSLINWGKRNLNICVFDENNITEKIMCQFEDFHIEVSQRRTRSHKSWMLQYEAIKEKMAFLILGYLENKMVSAILILCGQAQCYYGVAVNQRDLMGQKMPLGHEPLMKAIFTAKEKGYKRFNIGNVTESTDDKLNAIAKYKRGFSNTMVANATFTVNI